MDYIEPGVSENDKYLQERNASTREQLAQQPPQFQPVQEPQQQKAQQREVLQPKQLPVPQLEPLGTTTKAVPLQPPPGLEHVPVPPLGLPGTTAKAPPIAPPPQPARPQPVAGPLQHRPVGKHDNPARQRPQPQQAYLKPTVLQQADMDTDNIHAYNCYNLTMETNVLHPAVNEDKKERQLQQELVLDHAVLLPGYHYHDSLEQYDKQEVLTATKKELDKLRLEGHVRRMRQVYSFSGTATKTRWVVGDRPDPSTTTTTGDEPASELRTRFVANRATKPLA